MESELARITVDPNICHGKPCVRGLRYPVAFLLELLSSGMSYEEILTDYPDRRSAGGAGGVFLETLVWAAPCER